MVTPKFTQGGPVHLHDWMAQHSPLRSLKEFANLANRLKEGESFRQYVLKRLRLVVPLGLVVVATAIASVLGVVGFLSGVHSFLTLLGLLLAPFVLIGSLLVQGYLVFSWLEGRALARAYGKRAAPSVGLPPMPWVLAIACVALPMLMLMSAAPQVALFLVALHVLAPIMFTRLDR